MDSTRATIALDFIRRATSNIVTERRNLERYERLARSYGCSEADIAEASQGIGVKGSAYEPVP
jgi:hypothetical protein